GEGSRPSGARGARSPPLLAGEGVGGRGEALRNCKSKAARMSRILRWLRIRRIRGTNVAQFLICIRITASWTLLPRKRKLRLARRKTASFWKLSALKKVSAQS